MGTVNDWVRDEDPIKNRVSDNALTYQTITINQDWNIGCHRKTGVLKRKTYLNVNTPITKRTQSALR
jgi:hypothetical protein